MEGQEGWRAKELGEAGEETARGQDLWTCYHSQGWSQILGEGEHSKVEQVKVVLQDTPIPRRT